MSHLHLLLLLLLLLAEETSLTIVLGDGQRGPVKRPGTVRKRSARCDAFERDGREDLPGERVRQVRGKGSDGQLDRHLDRVVYLLLVGRHALVHALVLSRTDGIRSWTWPSSKVDCNKCPSFIQTTASRILSPKEQVKVTSVSASHR